MKRILALLLMICTVFLLCACPGGGPVEPPVGGDPCDVCGKDPCECPEESNPPPTGGVTLSPNEADLSLSFGAGKEIAETGDGLAANDPVLSEKTYDAAAAIEKPAVLFFRQVSFNGGVFRATNDAVAVLKNTDAKTLGGDLTTTLIAEAGIEISACRELVIRNVIFAGDVTVKDTEGLVFENVQFNGKVTVAEDAEGTVFRSCRFASLENAGTDTYLLSSCFAFTGVGITNVGEGLFLHGCRLTGTGTAITSTGDALELRRSTVETDAAGIGAEIKDSANSLVALSVFTGTQRSVVLEDAKNTAVVRNSLVSVTANGGKNMYVCDNEMGGRLMAENNSYLLADGNTYPADGLDHRAVVAGNENVNGNTLTDVNARAEAGVKEELLPHLDRDLFLEMERRETVKDELPEKDRAVYKYLTETAKESAYVVLAPGAYTTTFTAQLDKSHSDTTVYAYGAYVEADAGNEFFNLSHLYFNAAERIAFKGLTLGYALPSCGQAYVLENTGALLRVIPGAGMIAEFTKTGSKYYTADSIGIQRAGTFYAIGDYVVKSASKNADGTINVVGNQVLMETAKKGDILTVKNAVGQQTVDIRYSADISFTDMTTYGYSGDFLFHEEANTSATRYTRIYNTTKSGAVISRATYDKYKSLQDRYGVDLEISIDGQGRCRGSLPHIGSLDGTHVKKCVQGAQLISCIFENMADDGTNHKAAHARLHNVVDNGDGTTTLYYKGNIAEWHVDNLPWKNGAATNAGYCAPFVKGDRVFVYTAAGQLVCDAEALSAQKTEDPVASTHPTLAGDIPCYSVTVPTDKVNREALAGYDLFVDDHAPDGKVLVDNMTRSSNGFLFDNCLIRNIRSRGLLIKASNGTVKNCTVANIAKVGIAVIYEMWWGESGVCENLTIENNVIDNTAFAPNAPAIESDSHTYKYVPIAIMGLGGKSLDPDFLLYKDITVKGNKFTNRRLDVSNYAIYVRAACDLTITDNDFGWSEEEDGAKKMCQVLYLAGAMNVELSRNTYSPSIGVKDYVNGTKYKNIFGSDVPAGAIPDKE